VVHLLRRRAGLAYVLDHSPRRGLSAQPCRFSGFVVDSGFGNTGEPTECALVGSAELLDPIVCFRPWRHTLVVFHATGHCMDFREDCRMSAVPSNKAVNTDAQGRPLAALAPVLGRGLLLR
jgi:hypothetical protein